MVGNDTWEKVLRIAVDCKLNMSHQHNMTARKANEVLDCINIIIYKSQEVIVGHAPFQLLYPVLEAPLQEEFREIGTATEIIQG